METKKCSECKSDIAQDAIVCPVCHERIDGVACSACASFNKKEARICKWCGTSLSPSETISLDFDAFETRGEFLPTLLLAATFLPQKCFMSTEKIVISTPHAFGLAVTTEEVLWNKITGFQHHSGIMWDHIAIETRGQTKNQIANLSKENAQKIVAILQKLQK